MGLRNPHLDDIADVDFGQNFFPSGEHRIDGCGEAFVHFERGVESLSVFLCPSGEIEFDEVGFGDGFCTGRCFDDFIDDATGQFDGIFGRVSGRHGWRDDVDDIEIEDERACGCARLAFVCQILGNPSANRLANFCQSHRFVHAGDEVLGRKDDGIGSIGARIEHVTVGRPARVVEFDEIGGGNGTPLFVRLQFFIG